MADIVVTVPLSFGLQTWIDEGDPAGTPWSGEEWHFYLGGPRPSIAPGERVYAIYNGALRGYSPLVRIDDFGRRYGLVRHGDAVAISIPEYIRGFQGWRYRWWDREQELPFPNWQDPDAALFERIATKRAVKNRAPRAQRRLWEDREYEADQEAWAYEADDGSAGTAKWT